MLFALSLGLALVDPLASSALAGNVRFDPLRLSSSKLAYPSCTVPERIHKYREAELKHGRLAMLAAVAYPAQEKLNPLLSSTFDLPNLLADHALSPSLVNGGLRLDTLLLFLGVGAVIELRKQRIVSPIAGDYRWRIGDAVPGSKAFFDLQAGEVWNGRIAMVAVLGYVVQEAVARVPVL
tara:strand:- start:1505 stop:2044 length:540 start_codon:yes stop_codon:yes gene_type:complete